MATPPSSNQPPASPVPAGPGPEPGSPAQDTGPKPAKPSMGKRAARALRRERDYPHGIHPGLVPGIAVDDQRVRYGTDRLVFGVAAALILGFVAWGIISTDSLKAVSDGALSWVVENTGWLFRDRKSVV